MKNPFLQRRAPHPTFLTLRQIQALEPGQSLADSDVVGLTATARKTGRTSYSLRIRTANGQQRWVLLGHAPDLTPQEARARAQWLKTRLREADGLPPSRADLVERYSEGERDPASPRAGGSLTGAQYISAHFAADLIGSTRTGHVRLAILCGSFAGLLTLPLAQITVTRVLRWRAQALADGSLPPTINRRIALLRGLLSHAVDRGVLPCNPLSGLRDLPLSEDAGPRRLSPDEHKRLFGALLTTAPRPAGPR